MEKKRCKRCGKKKGKQRFGIRLPDVCYSCCKKNKVTKYVRKLKQEDLKLLSFAKDEI